MAGVREFVMVTYAAIWSFVVIVITWRTGEVPPPELWAALGVGEGALIAVFKTEERVGRHRRAEVPAGAPETEDETA